MFAQNYRLSTIAAAAVIVAMAAVAPDAGAKCSREINVPVSATGQSVTIVDGNISGIYPEILRSFGSKEACSFNFSDVPRSRLEVLFNTGKADLLIPASRTPARDKYGIFIPLVFNRATIISIDINRPVIKTAQELLDRKELKVVLVRGYDYGDAYQALVKELNKQGRVVLEADPVSVARMLKANTTHITIMAPSIFVGAIKDNDRAKDILDKLRYEPIEELPWGDSGVYISKSSLSEEDKASLKDLLQRAEKSGAVWKSFQNHYDADILKESIRPR
ncbi:transporter substrate-binding domain-containing protein [Undibacterium sp. 5I1]|uniref:substrate-binding periplasmic protein n=1 Tax=unclassified Undibacterium TaxID=2630295 RepID=UPI002AB53D36|nr:MULTISPECIES: transporter substrate-binding domain-containing protein [unclassified Undibacterium]MDY7539595.1 transporter substrate-binding domain-containing protein [Undibacterium sp. 5I1]MEB0230454.1 transporter substrate-binding domain-containing protein [Undibacterium sp. 10I3]MEB0258484.1 transporter substrate-binding domain-containing protein [Undibacterium sp. 5I1]